MRISLKFLDDAFTVMVLFLGTGAFVSLTMDTSNPNAVTDGSMVTQLGWSLIYIVVLVRAVPRRREIIQAVKSNKSLVLLVLLAIVSAVWSEDAGLSVRRGFAVLATTLFGIDFPDAWNGAFVQKNDFARLIVLAGILLLMRTKKFLVGVAIVGASAGLIALCHSKTALVVLVAMLLLLRIFRLRRWGKRALIAGIAGVLILSGVLSVVVDFDTMAGLLGRDATLTGRTNIWAMAIESIEAKPLLGYGYNAFWNVAPEADRISNILHWKVPHAHNGFIDLTLQLGFVGLALFMICYLVAVRRALTLAHDDSEEESIWPLAYLAFIVLYQVTESTIFVGNSLLWMIYVSTLCSVSLKVAAESTIAVPDSTFEPVTAFAAGKEYV
jgi:exopolysaccharide production protein ExoQ